MNNPNHGVTTLFVLNGQSGSYEDTVRWTVMAYETQEAAEIHRELAEEAYAQAREEVRAQALGWSNGRQKYSHYYTVCEPTPYDPFLRDYDGHVYYYVTQMPMRAGPLSREDIANARYVVPGADLAGKEKCGVVTNSQLADKLGAAFKRSEAEDS